MKKKKLLILSLGTGGEAEQNMYRYYFEDNRDFSRLDRNDFELYQFLKERGYGTTPKSKETLQNLHKDLIRYSISHMDQRGTRLADKTLAYAYPYVKTTYQMPDQSIRETEYIGELLAEDFHPDYILVLGTVVSAWDNLYLKLGENIKNQSMLAEDALHLYSIRIDPAHHMNTGREELGKCQDEINACLSHAAKGNTTVKALVLRYGINEEQQKENERILEEELLSFCRPDCEYEAAIDITHSFRSLPLQTITALNYIRECKNLNLQISHVYYGCFEAKRENNKIAPVVDLEGMMRLNESVNAVNQFKMMGSVNGIACLSRDAALKQALEQFAWAMQTNVIERIAGSLRELMNVLDSSDCDAETKDLKEMLKEVLRRELLGSYPSEELDQACSDIYHTFQFQCSLIHWYQHQKQYGIMMSVETECFRSLSAFLMDPENAYVENTRRDAAEQLGRLLKDQPDDKDEELLKDIYSLYTAVTPMRDYYAHNFLSGQEGAGSDEVIKLSNEMADKLLELSGRLWNRKTINKLRKPAKQTDAAAGMRIYCCSKKCRILLGKNNKENNNWLLPESLAGTIPFEESEKQADEMNKSAAELASYLKHTIHPEDRVIVITKDELAQIAYRSALLSYGIKNISIAVPSEKKKNIYQIEYSSQNQAELLKFRYEETAEIDQEESPLRECRKKTIDSVKYLIME